MSQMYQVLCITHKQKVQICKVSLHTRSVNESFHRRSGSPHVYLDISHCQRDHVLTHFPNIAAQCLGQGIDITKDPIPVAPAAHFMCGGVKVRPWGCLSAHDSKTDTRELQILKALLHGWR